MLKHRLATLLFCLALPFSSQAAEPETPPPLQIVASFSILGDLAKQVGGDAVAIHTLVGADSDAHGYQPTSADLKAVAAADIVFVNGLGFDGWLPKLAKSAKFKGKLVTVSQGVAARTISEPEDADHHAGHDHDGQLDPHAWQDLRHGQLYVDNIVQALAAARPAAAQTITARAAAYKAELAALDDSIRAQIAAIPAAQRVVITSHDAFGYFGAAYGVTFHAPQGLSTEAEPSAKAMARFLDQVKAAGIKTVFVESMHNPRLIEQLGRDAGAKLGGTLYSDALSAPDGPAPDYQSMFKHNVALLSAAMRGM